MPGGGGGVSMPGGWRGWVSMPGGGGEPACL